MEPLDIVKQTGTTIIFEEFNRAQDKTNLVTLLLRDAEEIPLELFVRTLNSELVVRSFAEFVEKFSPTIYETTVTAEDGSLRFVYSSDKPGCECTEIKLHNHPFFKLIMDLIDRQADSDKEELQDIYKASLESFAETITPIIEKFAGVKSFFDHASCDGELPRDVSVIISNCKVDAILKNRVAKERFRKYFKALSYEKDVNRIWFGIIPAISNGEERWSETKQALHFDDDIEPDELEDAPEQGNAADLIALDRGKEMLALLEEAKIMTFVNYKAGENTGFMGLSASEVDRYRKDFKNVNSEYAVFVYPNFTILPKENGLVKIGTEYNAEDDQEVDFYAVVPGVYLDASYVACGMMVGVQNYKLLEKKGYYVNPKYPCVRFDLEDPENSRRVTTKLNRETTTETPMQILDAIMEDRFGFVFADNNVEYDGKILKNSYVLNARSLQRGANGEYKPLYKTLVKNLVSQILGAITGRPGLATQKEFDLFAKEFVDIWKADNSAPDRQYDNRILFENESIILAED